MRDDCPQTVLRRLYAGAEFEWMFTGTFAERVHMYDPVCAPRTPFWGAHLQPLHETGSRVVNCLIAILHQLTICMQESNDLALYLYFDAHVPLAIALESADSLTDETVLRLAQQHAPIPTTSSLKEPYPRSSMTSSVAPFGTKPKPKWTPSYTSCANRYHNAVRYEISTPSYPTTARNMTACSHSCYAPSYAPSLETIPTRRSACPPQRAWWY